MILKNIDFKLAKIISAICAIIFSVSFFQASYFIIIEGSHKKESFSWLDTFFYYSFLDWIVVVPIMILIAAITKQLFKKQLASRFIILFHSLTSFIIGWFILLFQGVIQLIIGRINIVKFKSLVSIETTIKYLNSTFLIYLVLLGVIYIYYYIERIKDVEQQKSILSNQLNESKMKALKAQLQPHFLFNTLNSISTLIEVNAKQAQNTLIDLSELLREILNLKENSLVPLSDELKIVEKYIDIIKVRFSDHFNITYVINDYCLEYFIPSMLIQPLVENSVKHGFSPTTTDLKVTISITKRNEDIIIKVSNNGESLSELQETLIKNGTGLKNIIDRLTTIYKDNYSFKIYNQSNNEGVTTEVKIPFKIKSYEIVT